MAVSDDARPNESHDDSAGLRDWLVPQSGLFWIAIGVGILLYFIGRFLITGPMAAIMGVWAFSLFGGALLGYVLFRIWYVVGT